MKFPNAAKGISKIFTSEILALIAAIATGVASILAAVMYASAKTNSTAGAAASGTYPPDCRRCSDIKG